MGSVVIIWVISGQLRVSVGCNGNQGDHIRSHIGSAQGYQWVAMGIREIILGVI